MGEGEKEKREEGREREGGKGERKRALIPQTTHMSGKGSNYIYLSIDSSILLLNLIYVIYFK